MEINWRIVVEPLSGLSVASQHVERKGLGHPDSICDAMMEAVSVALSEAYLEQFGPVLHHHTNKGWLIPTCTSWWRVLNGPRVARHAVLFRAWFARQPDPTG